MNVLYDPILGCLRKSDVDPAATPEVVNVANFATLPTTGALATIYIVGYQDEYIWDGSGYVQLNAGSAPVQDAPLFFAIAATTAALPTVTYNNGAGTLTKSTNGALVAQDGITLAVGDVLLVKNQASTLQNGLYEVTTVGDGSNPFVLTRPTDYNQTAEIYPSQVNVLSGTTNGTKYFLQTTVDPTIGTDPIVYSSIATPVTVNYTVRFVSVHTTTVLPNSPTYANGSSLTAPAYLATYTATTNGAFPTLQGVAPYVNMIVLVKDQADATKNGDYQLITIGTASTKWKLRRISYSSGQFYRQLWEVYEGTDKGKFYEQTTSNLVSLNIGTTGNIVFADVSPTSLFTQGSGFAYLTTTTDLFQVGSSSSLGASLGVKGQGATSGTFNQRNYNSASSLLYQLDDAGGARLNGYMAINFAASSTYALAILGSGTSSAAYAFYASNSAGGDVNAFILRNDGQWGIGQTEQSVASGFKGGITGNTKFTGDNQNIGTFYASSNVGIGFAANATYRLIVLGSGTTSAAYSFYTTDSGGADAKSFSVRNDGRIAMLQATSATYNIAATGNIGLTGDMSLISTVSYSKATNNKLLSGATTDAATAVELTTDGAVGSGATNRIAVPADTTLSIVLNIAVKQSGSANAKQMLRQVVITNNGGTTALSGTVIALGTDTGDAGLATVTCTITANNTDDCLKVEVNGVVGTNLRYTCFVVSTETTYA